MGIRAVRAFELGTLAALAVIGVAGCSGDQGPKAEQKTSSISFGIKTSGGVQIDTVHYDLDIQGGGDVVNGDLPVPDDQSTDIPLLGISSLGAGAYQFEFTANGVDASNKHYLCDSGKIGFNLAPNQNLALPGPIILACSTTVQVDASSSVTADVSVTVSQSTTGSVIETFTYGPRDANCHIPLGGGIVYSPITLKIANTNPAIAYAWTASPDGTFTTNSTNTLGTYNCASSGDKLLTLTGVLGGTTSTKDFTVSCQFCDIFCGNGIREGFEQCDDNLPHCQPGTCAIVPVCGDNIIDFPETCEPPNTATCNATCSGAPGGECGDNVIDSAAEQCDDGAANSDTTPDACRTNCTSARCGDNVIDTGEQCEPPNTGSCTATCHLCLGCGSNACIDCIEHSAADGSVQATYCDPVPACLVTEKCIIQSKCFNPLPAFCYCGTTDVTACLNPAFAPVGPCRTEIIAGENSPADNATALQQFNDFTIPSGTAQGVLNDAFSNAPECRSLCF